MATDYLAFSVAFHEADAERVLSHGAKAPLLETADIRNHYALVFALVAFLREHKLRAGWIENLRPILDRLHLEFAILFCRVILDTPSFRTILGSRTLNVCKERAIQYLFADAPVRHEDAGALLLVWRDHAETASRKVRRLTAYTALLACAA
jgi:hypothetical protein